VKKSYFTGGGLIPLATIGLAACVANPSIPEPSSVDPIDPIERPVLELNQVMSFTDEVTGEPVTWTVVASDAGKFTTSDQNGCSWTSSGDPMEPSVVWENCGSGEWGTGGIMDAKIKGSVWPMEIGKKVTYTQRFYNSTDFESSKSSRRKCEVTTAVSVEIGTDSIDALKLVCKQNYDNNLERVYWFSPENGLVKYRKGSANKPDQLLLRQL